MGRRVVISGIGWVTPLGNDIESVWKRLLAGENGIGPTTVFDASTFPTTFSAEVKCCRLEDSLSPESARLHASASRNTQFALGACMRAWQNAGLAGGHPLTPERVGIYLGGGEAAIDLAPFSRAAVHACRDDDGQPTPLDVVRWARAALEWLDATNELEQGPNLAASHIAVELDIRGPSFNTLTACAASTQAIGEATAVIRRGDADVMISGGTHSMLHPLGVTGFNRLTALSTRNDTCATASRPFDRTRDGFVLGEGSGVVILEELEHARNRRVPLLAEVIGFGSTADAFRITDMHETGRGPIGAIRAAIETAGIRPQDVDYISAHGTSTEENDKIETMAIKEVFGEYARSIPISSIKSMIGHLIAAAGAVELITCVLAIRDGVVLPTINYVHPDPNCDLDYVPNEARTAKVRTAMSNSFGFGGQNDTLVIRAIEG